MSTFSTIPAKVQQATYATITYEIVLDRQLEPGEVPSSPSVTLTNITNQAEPVNISVPNSPTISPTETGYSIFQQIKGSILSGSNQIYRMNLIYTVNPGKIPCTETIIIVPY